MRLKDLNQIAINSQKVFLNYKKEEVVLTPDFKKKYTEYFHSNNGDKISFAKHTTLVETSGGLTISFPNQWFYIASYFIDYLIALKTYKTTYNLVFKNESKTKEIIKNLKDTGEVDIETIKKINLVLKNEKDVLRFKKFLSDYKWWFGSKTIDRSDYFVSPILSLSKVVNVTQSYIADLAYKLSEKPDLLTSLKKSKLSTASLKEFIPLIIKKFNISQFHQDCATANLKYSNQLITRYISSLVTKPFVLLSGLSGSGKTKLAQSFAQWICEDEKQYCIVPVGADWTNREPLLGYVNALDNTEYILPENGALQLLIEVNKKENEHKPYFLILDEMNLSHVERYFADFLSVMESKDKFKLHTDTDNEKSGVPHELDWPKNLFVVGTVNIDETTYMFSPKVLDRANAIEFRVTKTEIESFLTHPAEIDLEQLEKKGAAMGASFVAMAKNKDFESVNTYNLNKTLVDFFVQLKKTGAEFGYRTGMEIHRLYQQITVVNANLSENDKIDIAVMQKLLPKLHGSRRKLCPILETLANLCVKETVDVKKDFLENIENLVFKGNHLVLYPLSLEKITRMYKGAVDNGFASYAEA